MPSNGPIATTSVGGVYSLSEEMVIEGHTFAPLQVLTDTGSISLAVNIVSASNELHLLAGTGSVVQGITETGLTRDLNLLTEPAGSVITSSTLLGRVRTLKLDMPVPELAAGTLLTGTAPADSQVITPAGDVKMGVKVTVETSSALEVTREPGVIFRGHRFTGETFDIDYRADPGLIQASVNVTSVDFSSVIVTAQAPTTTRGHAFTGIPLRLTAFGDHGETDIGVAVSLHGTLRIFRRLGTVGHLNLEPKYLFKVPLRRPGSRSLTA